MMNRVALVTFFTLALVTCARAADLHFIEPSAVDVVSLLPPPPPAGSKEAAAELELVLKAQANRTQAEIEQARAEADLSPAAFQEVLGESFTEGNFPKTYEMLKDAAKDSKSFSNQAKTYFKRPRPGMADAHVQPSIEGESDPSFPSGHATRGMLWALILSELAPDKKDALPKRGQEIGWDRLVAGLHYPSDLYAGRVLGRALAEQMQKDAKFQRRLAAAKVEFQAVQNRTPVLSGAGR